MKVSRTAVTCVLALVGGPAIVAAQERCPEGRPATGDVGIRALHCTLRGVGCRIWTVRGEPGLRHRFSVEPVVTEIADAYADPDGLEVGDVLVSVQGEPVTSPDGGRLLANLPVDERVTMVVRRAGRTLELTPTTRSGCGPGSLSVTGG